MLNFTNLVLIGFVFSYNNSRLFHAQAEYSSLQWIFEVSSCSYTVSIKDDPYWTSRKNSLELIELSSISKVSLV